jgi:hypothetical protein
MGTKLFQGFLSPASTMFNERLVDGNREFSASMESFAVHDFGWLFILPYEMCFVAWFILRKSEWGMQQFHETLTACSLATVVFIAALQAVHPRRQVAPFDPTFFAYVILFHSTAVAISGASIVRRRQGQTMTNPPTDSQRYQEWRARSARWSIPGTALFVTSGINTLMIVASLQVLVKRNGLETYFDIDSGISQVFMTSLILGLFYLGVHAFLLYRLRYNIMEVHELKYLCFYKFLLNLILPLFWMPEFDPLVHGVDRSLALFTRVLLATVYFIGYRLAGVGDSVARILVGEQAD